MQSPIKTGMVNILKPLGLIIIGVWIGWLIFGGQPESAGTSTPHASEEVTEWTCSMDPQVRSTEPGKCPLCGMDLIPLVHQNGDNSTVVQMSPLGLQLAGVRTEIVGRGNAVKSVRLNGKIQPDERLVYSQSAHLDGRIERLLVNYTGEYVRAGQVLAYVYAPELVTAQNELFLAKRLRESQPALFAAAREKLKNWKLSDQQIDSLLRRGEPQEQFPILADVSGQVKAKKINLGDYVMRGTPLYEIMDLSKVWVLFDAYESDLQWVKRGSKVNFSVQSLPGEEFTGVISFIDPLINPMTRVATARLEIHNPGQRFKPEMFVTGYVLSQLKLDAQALLVPKTAVLWTGERSVVYVKQINEQGIGFYLQEVTLGPELGDHYVIKTGLQAGEEIATSGTFSIDAAAQLAGKPSAMKLADKSEPAGPDLSTQVSPEFIRFLDGVVNHYLSLKDVLVLGQPSEAKKQAELLLKSLGSAKRTDLATSAAQGWIKHHQLIRDRLTLLLAQNTLDGQRVHFKALSTTLIQAVQVFGSTHTLYVQHCPMAMDNVGADWLSATAEIRNPYFGDLMLNCGKVVKTFNQVK